MNNKKRDYPLFIIDRSKNQSYPYDIVVCLDKSVGFVSKVMHLPTDLMFNEFLSANSKSIGFESVKTKKGGIIIQIVEYLFEDSTTPENQQRIKTLLKKGFKKFLHAEIDRTPHSDCSIENQILQQELTIERARSNYSELVARAGGDTSYADYQIALAEATLDTLKKYRDNQKYFTLNMN